MALVSPGVEVTVIDQSQYLPAPAASVPFVLIATQQDKANPNGTGKATGTLAANAGKLVEVTSQRELTTLFGTPFFYETSDGTPIQGYELNEYGLATAYTALGVTNRCYIIRADIDLASLEALSGRPTGAPADGTVWLDTTSTTWGIFEWDAATNSFEAITPLVITDSELISTGFPLQGLGQIGSYAVYARPVTTNPIATPSNQWFYKNYLNNWVELGNADWIASHPTVTGTVASPVLTPGDTFTLTLTPSVQATITVPGGATVADVAAEINALSWTGISAGVSDSKLVIYSGQDNSTESVASIALADTSGTPLADMGIDNGTYYQPRMVWGTSSQQPLWSASQDYPAPSGSVWMKAGSVGNGLNPVMSVYDDNSASFKSKSVNLAQSEWALLASADSTGGQNIAAGTLFAQYGFNGEHENAPLYVYSRLATGPTVVTGTETSISFTSAGYARVQVSIPASASLSSVYSLAISSGASVNQFITAWVNAAIPYTTITQLDSGAIQITHTEGGVIIIDDTNTSGADKGKSSGLLAAIGMAVTSGNENVVYGPSASATYTPTQNSTSGVGTGLQFNVTKEYGVYIVDTNSFVVNGSGYAVGDTVTVLGTNIGGSSPLNDLVVKVTQVDGSGAVQSITYESGVSQVVWKAQLTNFVFQTFTANEGAPVAAPANKTNWYYAVVDEVDIMVNTTAGWKGYKNVNFDDNGFPEPTLPSPGAGTTDPNGPICSASEPTTQSDGTPLVYGDLWIDNSAAALLTYPVVRRWQNVGGEDQWQILDTTDQTSSTGVLFADARWSSNQNTINPVDDPIPTIVSLLSSNNLDLDAPEANLYPVGMLLFNTRRSGYNVKQYRTNYFNSTTFPDETLPTIKSTWVSASGLKADGTPYMGYQAQRNMVVQAMNATLASNLNIRDEDNFFNLMAAPFYPELQTAMNVLNTERGQTAYVIGDTPIDLPEQATALTTWANTVPASGGPARNRNLGLFYPSVQGTVNGSLVALPPSYAMLRTFLRNDTIAYPWLAAAGTRRGLCDNIEALGYVDRNTSEFVQTKTRIGTRDVLYTNFINPLVYFTGNGFLNYGNKTSFNSQSALDRTNVARLVCYIRRQLTIAARPFVFEPNDALTRQQIAGVIETLMVDLVAKRGIYDYLVVCDESNNTPARIDRNELWVDVAIEPVKAAEFIYIPVRVLNTGELSGA